METWYLKRWLERDIRNWRRMTPARILLLLRSGEINSWRSLCDLIGIQTRTNTATGRISFYIGSLLEFGLVSFPGADFDPNDQGWEHEADTQMIATPKLLAMQSDLKLSLVALSSIDPDSMVVWPFFGAPKERAASADVFVAMALAPTKRPLYDLAIRPAVEESGLAVARADDFFGSSHVVSDIWSAICGARVVMADCTERNPNVFYEMGIAHAIGRQVILLMETGGDPPFDIGHLRYLAYDQTDDGLRALKDTLKRLLEEDGAVRSADDDAEYPASNT